MARIVGMFKPGEKAPHAGAYYCYVCSLRGETSACEMTKGQLFLACPKCLERKVAEWDLVWKSADNRPTAKGRLLSSLWPGAIAKPV